MFIRTYVCTYVRMYVCTYVHMYVCTYVHMYVYFERESWLNIVHCHPEQLSHFY